MEIGLELSLRDVLVLMFKVAPLSLRVMFEARMGRGKTTLANLLPPPKWSQVDIESMNATLVSKEQLCPILKEKNRGFKVERE